MRSLEIKRRVVRYLREGRTPSHVETDLSRGRKVFARGLGLLFGARAYFALIAIVIVFSSLSENYLTTANLLTMASHAAIFGLLGLGMLFVVLNGGIDLSVGSTLGLSGVFAGLLYDGVAVPFTDSRVYFSVPAVVVLCAGLGAFIGLINGIIISKFNVAPFVATLGTLYAVRGVAYLITDGLTYTNLGGQSEHGNLGFEWLGYNRIASIPIPVVIFSFIALLAAITLRYTVFGRWLYASGGNERASELAGVPVIRVKILVYVISGVCAAIAGLVLSSVLTSAGPNAGNTYELTAIAVVVIGGASLFGGVGNVSGAVLGALVISFLSDGLVIIGVSAYWQIVFTGAVIVLAVLINNLNYGGMRRRTRVSKSEDPQASKS